MKKRKQKKQSGSTKKSPRLSKNKTFGKISFCRKNKIQLISRLYKRDKDEFIKQFLVYKNLKLNKTIGPVVASMIVRYLQKHENLLDFESTELLDICDFNKYMCLLEVKKNYSSEIEATSYSKKNCAIFYSDLRNQPVISYEIKESSPGRIFIANSYESFLNEVEQLLNNDKNIENSKLIRYHEIVKETGVCKIYFDIECAKETNKSLKFNESCLLICKTFCKFIRDEFNIEINEFENVTYLTATRDGKYSMHVIFDEVIVAKNKTHLKKIMTSFLYYLTDKEREIIQKAKANEVIDITSLYIETKDVKLNGQNYTIPILKALIDMAPYDNGSLRTYYSSGFHQKHSSEARLYKINMKDYTIDKRYNREVMKHSLIQYCVSPLNVIECRNLTSRKHQKFEKELQILLVELSTSLIEHLKIFKDNKPIEKLVALSYSGDVYRRFHARVNTTIVGNNGSNPINSSTNGSTNFTSGLSDEKQRRISALILPSYTESLNALFGGEEKIEPLFSSVKICSENKSRLLLTFKKTWCAVRMNKWLNDNRNGKVTNGKKRHSKLDSSGYDTGQSLTLDLDWNSYFQKCLHGSCKHFWKYSPKFLISQETSHQIKRIIQEE